MPTCGACGPAAEQGQGPRERKTGAQEKTQQFTTNKIVEEGSTEPTHTCLQHHNGHVHADDMLQQAHTHPSHTRTLTFCRSLHPTPSRRPAHHCHMPQRMHMCRWQGRTRPTHSPRTHGMSWRQDKTGHTLHPHPHMPRRHSSRRQHKREQHTCHPSTPVTHSPCARCSSHPRHTRRRSHHRSPHPSLRHCGGRHCKRFLPDTAPVGYIHHCCSPHPLRMLIQSHNGAQQ